MKDIYFVECSECGFQTNVVLEGPPNEDTKVICESCKGLDSWY